MAQRCTKSTKLIEFQFKLLHRRIPTNDFLLKIGRKENDNCTFCNNSSETLIHLFAMFTSYFWKSATDWLQNALPLIGKYNLLNVTALGLRPELHSTEYSCQLNYCLLLGGFIFGKPKWMKYRQILQIFYAQLSQDLLQRKKQGTLKNATFLQIALKIALDIDCFLSLTVKYQKIF